MSFDVNYRDLIYKKLHNRWIRRGCTDDAIGKYSELYAKNMKNLVGLIDYISHTDGCYLHTINKIGDWFYITYNGNNTLCFNGGSITCSASHFIDIERASEHVYKTACLSIDSSRILLETDYKEFLDNVWKLYGTDVAMTIRQNGIMAETRLWMTEKLTYKNIDIWKSGDDFKLDNVCDNIDNILYLIEHRRIKNEIEEF